MPDNAITNSVNQAFSAQSVHYDADDKANRVLKDLRQQVYDHVSKYLKFNDNILELNAGTGIDASHFVSQGYKVLATDLSDGMVRELEKKGLDTRQLSYEHLDELKGMKFDYVFSNFGGLNCIDDLSKVTRHLQGLLKTGSYVTFVVMPPVCLWEIAALNFRRFKKNGVMAHIDGHYFRTWYHSLTDIRKSFGDRFEFIESEGLAALSPPPHRTNFWAYGLSRKVDGAVKRIFPFNRWADHIIVTFRLK